MGENTPGIHIMKDPYEGLSPSEKQHQVRLKKGVSQDPTTLEKCKSEGGIACEKMKVAEGRGNSLRRNQDIREISQQLTGAALPTPSEKRALEGAFNRLIENKKLLPEAAKAQLIKELKGQPISNANLIARN